MAIELGYETLYGLAGVGGLVGVTLGTLELVKQVTSQEQTQCILQSLKNWANELARVGSVVTRPNETIKPAIIGASAVYNTNVPVTDLFGHGILAKTKDNYLVFMGRVNPNWGRVVIAQGGATRNKYLGKKFVSKLPQALNNLMNMIGVRFFGTHFSLNVAEFGVIVLGQNEDWINPYPMKTCGSPVWYENILDQLMNFYNALANVQATLIPLYIIEILEWARFLKYTEWKYDQNNGYYGGNPASIEDSMRATSEQFPTMYFTVTQKVGLSSIPVLVSPASFIAKFIRSYGYNYPSTEILKIGIGAPLQSSMPCANCCSQYGNFGQIIGVGSSDILQIGNLKLGNQEVYVNIPYTDLSNITKDEIVGTFSNFGLGDLVKLGVIFVTVMYSIKDEIVKKYGDYAFNIAFTWVPYSDDENEIRSEAFSIAQRAYNVYVKAREEINKIKDYSALSYVEECVVEYFDPGLSEDEIVKQVVGCATAEDIRYRRWYFVE